MITLANYSHDNAGHVKLNNFRSHSYIGKPNRLRALEARNFIAQAKKPNIIVAEMFQATFDRGGLLGYITQKFGHTKFSMGCGAFTAYHPHIAPPQIEVVEAFVKPLHLKYIGGMRLYSQKKTLKADELDTYYEWYLKQFGKRLRRPKATAMQVIANELVPTGPEASTEALEFIDTPEIPPEVLNWP